MSRRTIWFSLTKQDKGNAKSSPKRSVIYKTGRSEAPVHSKAVRKTIYNGEARQG